MSLPSESRTAELVLPLHTEEISVSKQRREGDLVRISTVTREASRLVNERLTHERIEIERVPINRQVETAPPIREEGDTTIMSVVEEVVVVERRLMLKEEVRIRRVRVTEHFRETVLVREQDAVVTPVEAKPAA